MTLVSRDRGNSRPFLVDRPLLYAWPNPEFFPFDFEVLSPGECRWFGNGWRRVRFFFVFVFFCIFRHAEFGERVHRRATTGTRRATVSKGATPQSPCYRRTRPLLLRRVERALAATSFTFIFVFRVAFFLFEERELTAKSVDAAGRVVEARGRSARAKEEKMAEARGTTRGWEGRKIRGVSGII